MLIEAFQEKWSGWPVVGLAWWLPSPLEASRFQSRFFDVAGEGWRR
jgi:hypothetical protein